MKVGLAKVALLLYMVAVLRTGGEVMAGVSNNRRRITQETPAWNGYSEYDTLVLATAWQGSICSVKKCTPGMLANKNFFNVHGVWPNLNTDFRKSPFYCKPHKLKLEELPESDKMLINYYWLSLYNDPAWFINHEWTKHGTCWVPSLKNIVEVIPELKGLIKKAAAQYEKDDVLGLKSSYIQLNVMLGQKYNVFYALAENGILPDDHRRVRTDAVARAIRNAFGPSRYHLNCLYNNATGQYYINELKFSLNMNYKPTGTWNFTTECPELIVYPEYKVIA